MILKVLIAIYCYRIKCAYSAASAAFRGGGGGGGFFTACVGAIGV